MQDHHKTMKSSFNGVRTGIDFDVDSEEGAVLSASTAGSSALNWTLPSRMLVIVRSTSFVKPCTNTSLQSFPVLIHKFLLPRMNQ